MCIRDRTYAVDTDVANGTLSLAADGTYTYTPDTNYNGTDSFTYTVTDTNSGESATQTVNITVNPVNDTPAAVNDDFSGNEDAAITGDLATNDTLSGDGGNTYTLTAAPASGTATVNTDGTFTYEPDANFNGNDSFTYTLTDTDGDTSTATVTITVNVVDDLSSADDALTVDEDSANNAGTVATNDSTTSGGTLTYAAGTGPTNGCLLYTSPSPRDLSTSRMPSSA